MFEFCQTSPCCQNGVEDLMDYTCDKLGVKVGEPTPDGMFEVLDRDKFQPNADVVLRGFFAAMITVPTIFY